MNTALVAYAIARSLDVTDVEGHQATKAIARDGAVAIADACEKQPTDEAKGKCVDVYLVQAFRESGYQLDAVSKVDCRDHLTGRTYTVPWGTPCREGDTHVSFGPFQTGKKPSTWAEAVAIFTPLLIKSATTCVEPLAMVASGSCTNKKGIEISRARMAEADRIYRAHPFKSEGAS